MVYAPTHLHAYHAYYNIKDLYAEAKALAR
ncbi:hypothetical protein CCPUN_06800 [Cardinium endosymbiont of Culicoides punctatus]|nr:hypothetical protein CCPUN_06800 [Cardinium endosymbiont of Culicoides punctatus]